MTIKYHWDIIQNTEEWLQIKRGVISASRIPKIITPTLKIADNKDSRAIVYEVVCERAYDYIEDQFQSHDMERGHIEEIYAHDLYAEHWGETKSCGFITNDKLGFDIGFSPDWLIGENKFAECKSRKSHIQMKTILDDEVPRENIMQIQAGFFVSEREVCDYISYSNGYPMMRKEVFPDPNFQNAIGEACIVFNERVNAELERFMNKIADKDRFIQAPRRAFDDGSLIKSSAELEEIPFKN